MASDDRRYPILVDTDALIAVANSSLWNRLTEHVGLTTTNICKQELERHVENTRETAPEGSRPYRLHYGSRAALEALENVIFEVASAQGNVGLSAGITGPSMPALGKVMFLFNMWIGRLEIIPVLVTIRALLERGGLYQ